MDVCLAFERVEEKHGIQRIAILISYGFQDLVIANPLDQAVQEKRITKIHDHWILFRSKVCFEIRIWNIFFCRLTKSLC